MDRRVAFRKLRKGGQICEQGSFEGAAAHGKLGGLGACSGNFEKRHALRSILVHFWPCIICIIIYTHVSENLGGGGGERLPRGANAPLWPGSPPPPPP